MEDSSTTVLIDKVSSFDIEKIKTIPITCFNKRANKTTRLVNNIDPSNFLKGKNQWYAFEFESPIFAKEIRIFCEGYSSLSSGDLNVEFNGSAVNRKTKCPDGIFSFTVGTFVDRFSFKPERKFLGDQWITKVEVIGYVQGQIWELEETLVKIESLKTKAVGFIKDKADRSRGLTVEIENLEYRVKQLNDEISESESYIENLKVSSDEYRVEITKMKSDVAALEREESEITSRLEVVSDSIDKKKSDQRQLNSEISIAESELKHLKEEIRLFPSEISGFVKEGTGSVFRYSIMAAVPILVIVGVVASLFSGAVDLTVLHETEDSYELLSVLLTRLPFVLVSIAIIHACYRLAKVFISEIISINKQRLNLSKISIIATDVATAASDGLGFNDEELYQKRLEMKMELLREHMREYISADYKYVAPANPNKESTVEGLDDESEEDNY